jgi:sugar/nucleoside kinase (ribokinase family)
VLDLVIAGEAFDDFVFYGLDRLPKNGEELKTDRFGRSSGGGAVITAIAAARLGARCATFSGLSPDAARLLRDEGVGVRNLLRRGEKPAVSIAISTRQDRCFITFNGMNERLPGRLKPLLTRVRARHVHLAFHPRPCHPWIAVVESLRRRGDLCQGGDVSSL